MRSSTAVLEEVPARFSRFCSFVLARAGQSAELTGGPVLEPTRHEDCNLFEASWVVCAVSYRVASRCMVYW